MLCCSSQSNDRYGQESQKGQIRAGEKLDSTVGVEGTGVQGEEAVDSSDDSHDEAAHNTSDEKPDEAAGAAVPAEAGVIGAEDTLGEE